jgi:hypothetical protein
MWEGKSFTQQLIKQLDYEHKLFVIFSLPGIEGSFWDEFRSKVLSGKSYYLLINALEVDLKSDDKL